MCVNRCDSGCNREISDHNGWSVRGAGMSRRWKIFVAVVLAIPLLLFTGLSVLVDKTLGRKAVWQLIAGTFRGTRARPLTSRTFQPTPARMERGRYLVEGLAACFWCHSEHDPQNSMPLADRLGAGRNGPDFRRLTPALVSPNITPDLETGAGTWTDDMLARAMREGVGHDGRPLILPLMPYEGFRNMSDEDLASVVAYLRSIPPVRNPLPKMKVRFPFIRALRTGRVGARELKVMPWRRWGKVSDEDLGTIFAYLRTVTPVKHRVDNTEPPTYCRICGGKHGGGALN